MSSEDIVRAFSTYDACNKPATYSRWYRWPPFMVWHEYLMDKGNGERVCGRYIDGPTHEEFSKCWKGKRRVKAVRRFVRLAKAHEKYVAVMTFDAEMRGH